MPAVAPGGAGVGGHRLPLLPGPGLAAAEADTGRLAGPAEALAAVADSTDPVERVGYATEVLLRGVLARQGAVRAMIAAAITRPELAAAGRDTGSG